MFSLYWHIKGGEGELIKIIKFKGGVYILGVRARIRGIRGAGRIGGAEFSPISRSADGHEIRPMTTDPTIGVIWQSEGRKNPYIPQERPKSAIFGRLNPKYDRRDPSGTCVACTKNGRESINE